MKDFLLRSLAQKLVGIALAYLAAHGLDLTEHGPALTIAVIGLGATAWSVLVRFCETRTGKGWRALARVLMLGAGAKVPLYASAAVAGAVREAGGARVTPLPAGGPPRHSIGLVR